MKASEDDPPPINDLKAKVLRFNTEDLAYFHKYSIIKMKYFEAEIKAYASIQLIEEAKQLHAQDPDTVISMLNDLTQYEDWDICCASLIIRCVKNRRTGHVPNLVEERVKRWPTNKRWMMADIFDEVCYEIAKTIYDNPQDVSTLEEGVALFQDIKRIVGDVGVNLTRKSHEFMTHACYLQRSLQLLLQFWRMYPQSGLPYSILNYLSMYKALMVCGEKRMAEAMFKYLMEDSVDEHIKLIIKACDP